MIILLNEMSGFRHDNRNAILYFYTMKYAPVHQSNIVALSQTTREERLDALAVEEPLEISLFYYKQGVSNTQSISVTMRTPGQDDELATGFLFTEGIIDDVYAIEQVTSFEKNRILVRLQRDTVLDLARLKRHFYTTSSCGVCGKASIEAIHTMKKYHRAASFPVKASVLYQLPDLLRQAQLVFDATGGLHASALFDGDGHIKVLREDVGRHNALDKLIGFGLRTGIDFTRHVLLLSGRASFELIQKAAMAGIPLVAAIGAPSSLAVSLAASSDMTLVGFLGSKRMNIYAGATNIINE